MKVFISQPMRGLSDEEILKQREDAIVKIREKHSDVEIIDSFLVDEHKHMTAVQCLGQSIELLGEADLAVFLGKWKEARGCSIEHLICEEYGIPTEEL